VGAHSNFAAVDLELAASDGAGDLGTAPHVWFTAVCGDMPLPGVVRGTVAGTRESGSVVRVSIPPPSRGTSEYASDQAPSSHAAATTAGPPCPGPAMKIASCPVARISRLT